ncbi:MAG: hypothetical protein JSU01_19790 [Bacteroidetes bacterium]|nr:hypothetical protein [Bacteroidota bacterium]
MGRTTGRTARRTGNQKGQKKVSPTRLAANGFLRQQFLPLFRRGTDVPDQQQAEEGFFQSLARMPDIEQASATVYRDKPYPYNILLSYWHLKRHCLPQPDTTVSILSQDNGTVMLATQKIYDTGTSFYFIPVLPLHRLLSDRKRRPAAELLLSVFSYLYHIAGVPYYRDSRSAISYYYEMIAEWIWDDPGSCDEDEQRSSFSELNKAAHWGDVIFRKLFSRVQLEQFATRLNALQPRDEWERDCLSVARAFHELWQAYPQASLFRNMSAGAVADDDENGCIHAEQYISFVADTEGWLYEQVSEMLNSEFNECLTMEQPTILDLHDGRPKEAHALDFEERIFPLIEDVCTILNNLP